MMIIDRFEGKFAIIELEREVSSDPQGDSATRGERGRCNYSEN